MTRRAAVRQADITRAVLALESVGKHVTGVDIRPDGSFTVLTGEKAAELAVASAGYGRALEKWRRSA